ncbi:transcription factor MYB120-like [Rhopalosiphum maidis]|uniref:transcription factor MYB120-like n=1 Tax=Rhopalosiphum maidis TaxID=43146 RepID=UPI000EFF26FC|nr:transcription factor MYB120-like [Rhopalosiphum maidis]
MVLSDVNGNGKKSAAERWLRQRNGQRASAVRCIFGPPEKRAHLMVIMRNEAEMERKRIEFAARYEPVGMSPSERRNFFAGLIKSPPTSSHHHHYNNEHSTKNLKGDNRNHHYQQQQQQHHHHYYQQQKQQKNNSFNQPPDDERN